MNTAPKSQPDNYETAEVNREHSFIRTYIDLTGVNELQARAVFMFAGCRESIGNEAGSNNSFQPLESHEQHF